MASVEGKEATRGLVRRLLLSIFLPLLMAILGTLVNYAISWAHRHIPMITKASGIVGGSGLCGMNAHESQIAHNIVDASKITERMSAIGGLQKIKDDITHQVLLPLRHAKHFFSPRAGVLRPAKGVLLCGPPGTGKTMLARAIAAEANVPFVSLTLSTLENKYFGESTKLLAATFSLARKLQPCIIFFDELDGMMRTRSDVDQSCVYGLKTELLNQMDGLGTKREDAIIVIGCTNTQNRLDPAIRRRLPRVYEVGLPDENERAAILRLLLADEAGTPRFSIHAIARKTHGFSGSDLSELYRRASALRMEPELKSGRFAKLLSETTDVDEVLPRVPSLLMSHWTRAIIDMVPVTPVEEQAPDDANQGGVTDAQPREDAVVSPDARPDADV